VFVGCFGRGVTCHISRQTDREKVYLVVMTTWEGKNIKVSLEEDRDGFGEFSDEKN
jgi:hypothetical protein